MKNEKDTSKYIESLSNKRNELPKGFIDTEDTDDDIQMSQLQDENILGANTLLPRAQTPYRKMNESVSISNPSQNHEFAATMSKIFDPLSLGSGLKINESPDRNTVYCSDSSGQKVFTATMSEHEGAKTISYNILNIEKSATILEQLKNSGESFQIDKCNSTSALDKLIAKFGIDRLELGSGVTNPQVIQHFGKIQQERNNNPALDPTIPRNPATKPL